MKKSRSLSVCTIVIALSILVLSMGAITVNAFSDIYEPYYPQITATLRSTEEIYQRMSGPEVELKEGVAETRMEMIKMYQSVGIDVTYDMEHWSGSDYMELSFPQRYSRETPIPLGTSPDYSGAFSIDAPWNNKIPKDAPRVELSRNCLSIRGHMGVVKANIDSGGYGTGIAQVVGYPGDPKFTIVDKYHDAPISKAYYFPVPENVLDLVNVPTNSDEHTEFIDGEHHTSVQSWKSRVPGDTRGYGINNYLLPGYDVRCHSLGYETRLDGIGAEGVCGVNAAKPPTSAFTIKSSEISSTTEMINHALGGAIAETCGARVFPATMTDAHQAMSSPNTGSNGEWNRGVVPYGGVIQVDPELDLDGLYAKGKLSWHGYRILKAMQEYGFYNIDTSGPSFFFYTTTYSKDWINPKEEKFGVPLFGGEQKFDHVINEITAFFDNDPFFGLEEAPKVYVTVPVVKYADLDVNDDGVIDQTDHDLVLEHYDVAYTDETKQYDVNEDKVIDMSDVEIMHRYLENLPMHTWDYYDVSYKDNDVEHGSILVTGPNDIVDGITRYRADFYVTISAHPIAGYEFAGWTGDLEGETEPFVKVIMDRDFTVGAKYRKTKDVKFTMKTVGGGHVEATEDCMSYDAPEKVYGINTLLKLRAVPDEGQQFLGWYGDMSGYSTELDLLLDKDTEIIAVFGEPAFNEPFNPDDWYAAKGSDKYTADGTKHTLRLSDFNESWHVIAKNKYAKDTPALTGNFSIRADLSSSAALPGHGILNIFNFKDADNYYYAKVRGNGMVELGKFLKGKKIVMATSEEGQVVDGIVMEFPLTVEIKRDKSFLIVTLFKSGRSLQVIKTRDKSLSGGTIAFGGEHHGAAGVANVVISTKLVDTSGATEQNWIKSSAVDAWSMRLRDAVVVCADNSKSYAKNNYYDSLKDIKPYYAEDGKTLYVPVKYVVENLGGTVEYDAVSDVIVVKRGNNSVDYKAWVDGIQEKDGVLYAPAKKLATDIGKYLWKYHDVVFFSDTQGPLYTAGDEHECGIFVQKAFGVKYELYTNIENEEV